MRNNKTWFSWSTSFHYFRLKYNNLETKLTVSSRKNKWQRFPFQMVLIKESSPLQYIKTKVRWRFRQILWPSQNTWTLMQATWFCFYLPDIRSLIRSEKGYNRILLINFRIRDAGRTRGALVPPPPYFWTFLHLWIIDVKRIGCAYALVLQDPGKMNVFCLTSSF